MEEEEPSGYEYPYDPRGIHCCALAAKGGHLEALKWLRFGRTEHRYEEADGIISPLYDDDQTACPWDEWTCANAAAGGHLEVLRWARAHGCPWEEDIHGDVYAYASDRDCAALAARGGHLEVLRWLWQHDCLGDIQRICACAAEGGHLEVLKWLRDNDYPWHEVGEDQDHDENACARAAAGGYLEVLKWLQEHGSWAPQEATAGGHRSWARRRAPVGPRQRMPLL